MLASGVVELLLESVEVDAGAGAVEQRVEVDVLPWLELGHIGRRGETRRCEADQHDEHDERQQNSTL
ncbi:MAG: hypothetical protein BWY75_01415 [bacterium ADurb.Bin425]|nr:MAG: hypothetical protein BWY75_01415 [bacterium ADurb.Bin425]